MFSKAKVGDKVWSVIHGWGTITGVRKEDPFYPLDADFNDGEGDSFTFDGKRWDTDKYPELYWDEVHIIPPARPKRMVKETRELVKWAVVYSNGDSTTFKSYALARERAMTTKGAIQVVRLVGTYEIEVEEEED